jgi:hypothetical protein
MTDLLRAAQALSALDPRDTFCSRALAKPLAEYLAATDADDIDEMYRTQIALVALILDRIGPTAGRTPQGWSGIR